MKGELNRVIMVYVDSYQDKVPQGRFHIAAYPEIIPFKSLTDLLMQIQNRLEQERFPQSFTEIRRFQAPEKVPQQNTLSADTMPGKLATFGIRILFRQNASWQGSIRWTEGGQEESFRSVLEMITLLDSALSHAQ